MGWPYPIQTLDDSHQVWQLWAIYNYQVPNLQGSRWNFVTLRAPTQTQEALANLWREFLEPYYVARRPGDWSLHHLAVVDLWPGIQPEWQYVYPPDYGPDSSGKGSPPQISPVLTWEGGHPGRSYRGRTYWGPIRTTDYDEGFYNVDGRLPPIQFGNTITFNFSPVLPINGPFFVVLSRQHDLTPTTPAQYVYPAFFGVDSSLRTVRHRQTMPRVVIG